MTISKKIKIICTECPTEYEFLPRWFIKNDPKKFVCRNCKIKKTTQSNKFKKESRDRSIENLANEAVKSKMSIIATINNSKNAYKISKSLRKFYQNSKNKSDNSDRIKELWKTKHYRDKITDQIKNKWQDNNYRVKVLASKDKKEINLKFGSKDHNNLKKKLLKLKLSFEENYYLGTYMFDFFVDGKILIDVVIDNEKKLFVEHYFKQYKYNNTI